MRFYILTSKEQELFFFPLLQSATAFHPKYLHQKKAAHGLKAACDTSLSSVSLFSGAKLNPRPVCIMGQLDWLP